MGLFAPKEQGQTPANDVIVTYEGYIVDLMNPMQRMPMSKKFALGSIMPSATREIKHDFGGRDGWEETEAALINKTKKIIFWCKVDYKDIYKKDRETFFSGFINGSDLDGVALSIGPPETNYMK